MIIRDVYSHGQAGVRDAADRLCLAAAGGFKGTLLFNQAHLPQYAQILVYGGHAKRKVAADFLLGDLFVLIYVAVYLVSVYLLNG